MFKLLLGNMPVKTDEDLIRGFFKGTKGTVTKVSIPLDPKTHGHRGYAFVEMVNQIDAEKAVDDLNGVAIDGRVISCSIVEAPKARKWYQKKEK